MDIQLIDTGFFHADGGAMFGAIPKTAWSRRYPSDKQNGCILAMRSMLVRDGNGKIVLVDNGAGNKHLKQLSYYNFFDLVDLKDELQRRDVACEDVTDVILTHLHFDHCGYTTQKEEQWKASLQNGLPKRHPLGKPCTVGELPSPERTRSRLLFHRKHAGRLRQRQTSPHRK